MSDSESLTTSEELEDEFDDRAYGCMLGAFVGDSCGSYLGFQ